MPEKWRGKASKLTRKTPLDLHDFASRSGPLCGANRSNRTAGSGYPNYKAVERLRPLVPFRKD